MSRHLEIVANGLGAPSMLLLLMACRGELPATLSVTADTGWEKDRLWNDGRRSTARAYFDEVVVPLCNGTPVEPVFVRTEDGKGKQLLDLIHHLEACAKSGQRPSVPLFGADGGRLSQTCTEKWKIRAIRQECRRRGASTMRNAQGLHYGEAARRVSGRFLWNDGTWNVYRTQVKREGRLIDVKWLSHYYPAVDLELRRDAIYKRVQEAGVPFLISSECDGCPHKDLPRWQRTSPEVLAELARVEMLFGGQYFFTDQRVPLLEAIAWLEEKKRRQPELFEQEPDFGCGTGGLCGV